MLNSDYLPSPSCPPPQPPTPVYQSLHPGLTQAGPSSLRSPVWAERWPGWSVLRGADGSPGRPSAPTSLISVEEAD